MLMNGDLSLKVGQVSVLPALRVPCSRSPLTHADGTLLRPLHNSFPPQLFQFPHCLIIIIERDVVEIIHLMPLFYQIQLFKKFQTN